MKLSIKLNKVYIYLKQYNTIIFFYIKKYWLQLTNNLSVVTDYILCIREGILINIMMGVSE